MEDLRMYTNKKILYKLPFEDQVEKTKLIMKEVEKISAYKGISEEAAYNLFVSGYSIPEDSDDGRLTITNSELNLNLLDTLTKNNIRSIKVIPDEEYPNYAATQICEHFLNEKDNKF